MSTHGALVTTIIAFFLAEIGDKTQVATVLLAAKYSPLWTVVAGTTIGMLLANVPVVLLGSRFADRLPLRAARIAAALLFLAPGVVGGVPRRRLRQPRRVRLCCAHGRASGDVRRRLPWLA